MPARNISAKYLAKNILSVAGTRLKFKWNFRLFSFSFFCGSAIPIAIAQVKNEKLKMKTFNFRFLIFFIPWLPARPLQQR
jgi:hypothetical protein